MRSPGSNKGMAAVEAVFKSFRMSNNVKKNPPAFKMVLNSMATLSATFTSSVDCKSDSCRKRAFVGCHSFGF